MNTVATTGAGFLLAVLWFDLSICREHLLCLASIAALIALQVAA